MIDQVFGPPGDLGQALAEIVNRLVPFLVLRFFVGEKVLEEFDPVSLSSQLESSSQG